MQTFPMVPGVPAAGHLSGGFWHPGREEGCVKCPLPEPVYPGHCQQHHTQLRLVRNVSKTPFWQCPRCQRDFAAALDKIDRDRREGRR